jgi:MFS-type transporter involved in bile tolerance (Atg22 family)
VPLLQNESFPATLQSTGWGVIEGISQIGSFLTPFIVGFVTNAKLNPIVIICCVMLVLGLFPIKFIKETNNKDS